MMSIKYAILLLFFFLWNPLIGQVNFGATAGFYGGEDHAASYIGALAEGKITSMLRWELASNYSNRSALSSLGIKFYPLKRINLNANYFSSIRLFNSSNKPYFNNDSGAAAGAEIDFKSNLRFGFRYLITDLERVIPAQQLGQPNIVQTYNLQIYLGYTFRKD